MKSIYYQATNGENKYPLTYGGVSTDEMFEALLEKNSFPEVVAAINTLKKLPKVAALSLDSYNWRDRTFFNNKCPTGNGVYAVVVPSRAQLTLLPQSIDTNDNHVLHVLEHQNEFKKALLVYTKALIGSGFDREADIASVKKYTKFLKNINDGVIEEKRYSLISEMAETESYTIYVKLNNGYEGYLQANDHIGPLSQAKTYDNKEVLERAVRIHSVFKGMLQLQVVKLSTKVASLEEVIEIKNPSSYKRGDVLDNALIYEVGAHVQKRNIEEALKTAGIDELKDELERRQNTPKRKM